MNSYTITFTFFYLLLVTGWVTFLSVNQQHQSNEQRLGMGEQHVDLIAHWTHQNVSTSSSRLRLTSFSKCLKAFDTLRPRSPWYSRLYICRIQLTTNMLWSLETNKTNFILLADYCTALKNALTLMSPKHVPWLSSEHQEIWSLMSMCVHERYVENLLVHPSNPLNKNMCKTSVHF